MCGGGGGGGGSRLIVSSEGLDTESTTLGGGGGVGGGGGGGAETNVPMPYTQSITFRCCCFSVCGHTLKKKKSLKVRCSIRLSHECLVLVGVGLLRVLTVTCSEKTGTKCRFDHCELSVPT